MKKKFICSSLILAMSIVGTNASFLHSTVRAESKNAITTTTTENNVQIQPKTTTDSSGDVQPLKLSLPKVKAVPSSNILPGQNIPKQSNSLNTASTAPYTVINTPLGQAEYLVQGCSGTWVSALQSDLNSLSSDYGIGIHLTVDGQFGPATYSAVRTFQSYIRNSWGCSSMYIDGIAGYQTWTAIYCLFDGINPRTYIS